MWSIHLPTVNSPHKGQWCGALIFSLICVSTNGWINNRDAGDLRRYRAHHDVKVMGLSRVDHLEPVLTWDKISPCVLEKTFILRWIYLAYLCTSLSVEWQIFQKKYGTLLIHCNTLIQIDGQEYPHYRGYSKILLLDQRLHSDVILFVEIP